MAGAVVAPAATAAAAYPRDSTARMATIPRRPPQVELVACPWDPTAAPALPVPRVRSATPGAAAVVPAGSGYVTARRHHRTAPARRSLRPQASTIRYERSGIERCC